MSRTASSQRSAGWRFGPGLLVTAAFIGPGTVTTASRAGTEFGFQLLWTLSFAIVAAIVLQEMAARVGLVGRVGLAEAIGNSISNPTARTLALTMMLIGIVFGNTAYQTGNLIGAGIGIEAITGLPSETGAAALGLIISVAIAVGSESPKLASLLITIVIAMSVAFVATAVVARPDVSQLASGIITISMPDNSLLTALALVGTTVVPYNLFLHATAVQRSWPMEDDLHQALRASRLDTIAAITLGGLVTMAIITTAAATFFQSGAKLENPGQLAEQLQPVLGSTGKYLFAFGLTAAGLTSAVTAPLAASYVTAGVFPNASPRVAKITAVSIVLVGSSLALVFGKSPLLTILVAQAANGLLLPLVAVFLIWVVNRKLIMRDHRNTWQRNLLAGFVVAIACTLGLKTLAALIW
ncbi:MAG: Nramp family divalent metal transporter [Planctomycetota bacterium]